MAYTPAYASGDVASVIIDFLVAILVGLVNNGLLVGSAVAITLVVALYTGLLGRVLDFLKGLIGSAKHMSKK